MIIKLQSFKTILSQLLLCPVYAEFMFLGLFVFEMGEFDNL